MKFYSNEFKQQVINEYNDGTSVYSLSQKYNVALVTVYRWIRQNRKHRAYEHVIYSSEYKKQILDYYVNNSISIYALAKQFNIKYNTVYVWIKQANLLKTEVPKRYSSSFKLQVVQEYKNNNIYIHDLAKKYNISYQTAHTWIKQHDATKIKIYPEESVIINEYVNVKKNINYIAKKYNIYNDYVYKILINNNVNIRSKSYDSEFKNMIINEYTSSNISLNKLAQKYNIGRTTLTNWLKENNVNIKTSIFPQADINEVKKCYLQGMSLLQINKKFHISYAEINQIISTN